MQSTIVRTAAGSPEVKWCADCTEDVAMVRAAGYGGQDLIYLATERRGERDVCRRHAQMHDDLAAEIAAEEATTFDDDLGDLLALVEVTVWDEIDAVWAVAS